MKHGQQDVQGVVAQRSSRRIIRLKETEQLCGFRRSHIYALMRMGDFPRCRRIGARAVGWDSVEVEQWVADRLQAPH
ncbi:MAG: AlpA family transcriptional regulator [Pseudomonas sp.]|uniref:AlpA family transcriptional regulator n=1 Tax=Pseudomonas sp. TaxID=306 RepID=UPI003D0A0E46